MKTASIIISICIMASIANSKCNAQESSSNQLLNEFWICGDKSEFIHNIANSYEVYYFTPEGKFYYKSVWSSGTYFVNCSSGTYQYNPSSGEITLHIRESYARGIQPVDKEPDFTESLHTLKILDITDSIAVIEEIRENPSNIRRYRTLNRLNKEFRRFPCGGQDIFALPGIEDIFVVEQVKVRNIDTDLIPVNVNDRKELLEIILTARYDRLNNGITRNAGLEGNYYTIIPFMQEPPNVSNGIVHILISESSKSRIAVHCSVSSTWWYEIDETAGNRMIELLKKYCPHK